MPLMNRTIVVVTVSVLILELLGTTRGQASPPMIRECTEGGCGVQYNWYCFLPGMIEPLYNYCDKASPGCAGWP